MVFQDHDRLFVVWLLMFRLLAFRPSGCHFFFCSLFHSFFLYFVPCNVTSFDICEQHMEAFSRPPPAGLRTRTKRCRGHSSCKQTVYVACADTHTHARTHTMRLIHRACGEKNMRPIFKAVVIVRQCVRVSAQGLCVFRQQGKKESHHVWCCGRISSINCA